MLSIVYHRNNNLTRKLLILTCRDISVVEQKYITIKRWVCIDFILGIFLLLLAEFLKFIIHVAKSHHSLHASIRLS